MIIGVIGSDGEIGDEQKKNAEAVGRLVAESGSVLVCGGLAGVMQAACKGAKLAGGMTIGVLPTMEKEAANPYVDIPIVTGMGVARNVIIVRTADVLIAVGGRFGTLSEIAHALSMGKKVVSIGSWECLESDEAIEGLVYASSPEEAIQIALEQL